MPEAFHFFIQRTSARTDVRMDGWMCGRWCAGTRGNDRGLVLTGTPADVLRCAVPACP